MLQIKQFVLHTDSSYLKYLETLKKFNDIFAGWQMYLSEFDFQVLHRAGTEHTNADVLSWHDDVTDVTPEFAMDGKIMELITPYLQSPLIKESVGKL